MSVPATTTTAVPTAFLPFVAPFVGSAPPAVVAQAIAVILKEFLHETQVWQETLPAITLVAGQQSYALTPTDSTNTMFDTIVWANNASGQPMTPVDDYGIAPGKTGIYLTRIPPAGVSGTFTVRIALRLKTIANLVMDDRIFEDWHEVIADGVIARLQRNPDAAWESAKVSGVALSKYLKGVNATLNKYLMGKAAARAEVARGGINGVQAARYGNLRGYQ